MDSADGTHDEDLEQPYVPSGARRSTFTPPVSPAPTATPSAAPAQVAPKPPAPSSSELHDDDELAAALAAENERIVSNTQSIPIQSAAAQGLFEEEIESAPADAAPEIAEGHPAVAPESIGAPPVVTTGAEAPTPVSPPAPQPEQFAAPEPIVESVPFFEAGTGDVAPQPSAVEPVAAPEFGSEPWTHSAAPVEPDVPAHEDPLLNTGDGLPRDLSGEDEAGLPAEASTGIADAQISAEPAGAAEPAPVSAPEAHRTVRPVPERHALADEEIVRALDSAADQPVDTLSLIEALEAELGLRQQEELEYRIWENSTLALGTSEAVQAVQEARESLAHPPAGDSDASAENGSESGSENDSEANASGAEPPASGPEPEAEPEVAHDALPVITETSPPEPEPGVEESQPEVISTVPEEEFLPGLPEPSAQSDGEDAPIDDFDALLGGATVASVADAVEAPFPFAEAVSRLSPESAIPTEEPFVEALAPFDNAVGAVRTGSIELVERVPIEEISDVEELVLPPRGLGGNVAVDTAGIAVVQTSPAPPSGPIATTRIPENEVVVANNEPLKQPVFSLEESGLAPTPLDQRVGHASRMFWLWFAANSSIVSLGFGGVIFSLGMSLRQAIIATVIGVALSCLPLGLGTLAGKRSGQPAMVISRASFGLLGNILPSIFAILSRLFWGAVFLWLLAISAGSLFGGGALGAPSVALIALGISFLLVLLIAFSGYTLLSRVQLVLSILSGVLIVGFIAITAGHIDFEAAVRGTADGSWWLVVSGAVIVFSVLGLTWANSSSDLARYQRVGSSGAASMLWASFGTAVPAFVLVTYGILLAASDPVLGAELADNPLGAIASLLPGWYPIPLLLATGLSLLSGAAVTLYSVGFAIQATGLALRRQMSVIVGGVALLAIAVLLTLTVTTGITDVVRDIATSLAVPVAAWIGIFASDVMIRRRRYHSASLLYRRGVYPDINWVNLGAYVVIIAVSFGFTTANVGWLSWQGYLFAAVGIPSTSVVAGTDIGVLLALALGLLAPIVAGIGTIRRQEEIEGRFHARVNMRSAE